MARPTLRSAVLWLLAVAAPFAVAAAPLPPVAVPARPSAARVAVLTRLCEFLIHPRQMSDLMEGAASVTFRLRLQRADYVALEREYPGINAAIAAAVIERMARFRASALPRWQAEVLAYWDARLTDRELAALDRLLSEPVFREDANRPVPFREGDTLTEALRRAEGNGEARQAAMERLFDAFAATQPGRRIAPMIVEYQAVLYPRLLAELGQETLDLLVHAGEAGNAFARARYPERPEPFPNGGTIPHVPGSAGRVTSG